MSPDLVPTLFDHTLSDPIEPGKLVDKGDAEKLFSFFQKHSLFNWQDSHNGCEAKADAVCVLLKAWQLPHYKAWVFGGGYLKKHIGGLKKNWNYHVAPLLPVNEDGRVVWFILDPATASSLQPMYDWAAGITAFSHSYHFIKHPHWYIFHEKKIAASNWHARNRQNRKWMLQGLAGINGLSDTGKARLCFNKERLANTAKKFEALKKHAVL
ncbi:MAG: hypothetical protein IPP72_11010 [Chitinophagaceae bacterium]|nr:hypothetical protein [Chitinophagaceae bacterium]